jgi:hypothetical protein
MSIEKVITEKLINNGLFPDDAAKVVEAMKADPANEAMASRWNDDPEGYPPQIMALVWFSAKQHALEWIDANCPKAWYRAVFSGG